MQEGARNAPLQLLSIKLTYNRHKIHFVKFTLQFAILSVTFIYIKQFKEREMYTTTDEQGLLNNFAKEPKVYYTTYPSQQQQRRYLVQGAIASLLIAALATISVVVS